MRKILNGTTTSSQKVGKRDEDRLVIPIDQLRKSVGADLRYAWLPIDERPTVNVSVSRDGINFLGDLIENGETMFLKCAGSFSKETTVRSLQSLQARFGEKLLVILDKGSSVTAKKLMEFADKSK